MLIISFRVFLVSQDKDEIYVAFPRFKKSYGRNLKNIKYTASLREAYFLFMHEYGPFRLDSSEHVRKLASFIRLYTAHVAEQQANPS